MGKKLQQNIYPNELMYNYEDTSYVFKWYITPEEYHTLDSSVAMNIKSTTKLANGLDGNIINAWRDKTKNMITNTSDNQSIVVAETGVTANYSIGDVSIKTVNGGGEKVSSTEITMTIYEPSGCTLFDQMHLASLQLGLNDWRKAPTHILELSFNGKKINDNGTLGPFSECVFQGPNPLESNNEASSCVRSHWYWTFTITNVKAKVEASGATYTIQGILGNDKAKDVQIMTLPATVNATTTDTGKNARQVLDHIAKSMNEWYKKQSIKKPTPQHTFEFNWIKTKQYDQYIDKYIDGDDQLKLTKYDGSDTFGYQFTIETTGEKSIRNQMTAEISGNNYSWKEGTSIPQILQDIQISSPALRFLLLGKKFHPTSSDSGSSVESNEKERTRVAKIDFRIETEVVPKRYNRVIKDYEYHHIFHIVPYITSNLITDTEKPNDRKDINHQGQRIEEFNRSFQLCKEYNYIYTGKNQEILSFDIDLDFTWFVQLPKSSLSPKTYDVGTTMGKEHKQAFKKNETTLDDNALKTPDYTNDTNSTTKVKQKVSEINDISNTVNSSIITKIIADSDSSTSSYSNILNQLQTLSDAEDNESLSNISSNAKKYIGVTASYDDSTAAQRLQKLQKQQSILSQTLANIPTSDGKYVSTYNAIAQQIENSLKEINNNISSTKDQMLTETQNAFTFSGNSKTRYLSNLTANDKEQLRELQQLYSQVDPIQLTTKTSTEDISSTNDQGITESSVLSQDLTIAMLNQMKGGWLMDISLEIRGDPFWLGYDNTSMFESLKKSAEKNILTVPDWVASQNLFLLKFRMPTSYNEKTGDMTFEENNIFKGLYNAVAVEHKFSNGKFTQILEAKREALTDLLTYEKLNTENSSSSDEVNKTDAKPKGSKNTQTQQSTITADETTANNTSNDTPTKSSKIGNLNGDQMDNYYAAMRQRESSNNYQAENTLGYVGAYQMGGGALIDTGEVDGTAYKKYQKQGLSQKEILAKDDVWTSAGGKDAFLNDPARQDAAMEKYTKQNYKTLTRKGVINNSSSDSEIGGYLSASHLGGVGNAQKYSQGGSFQDAYGTDIGEYYNLGSNAVS